MATKAQKAAAKAAAAEAAKGATTQPEKTAKERLADAAKNIPDGVSEETKKLTINGKEKDCIVWKKDIAGETKYAPKYRLPPQSDEAYMSLENLIKYYENKKRGANKATTDKKIDLADKAVLTALLNKLSLEAVRIFVEIADVTADEVITARKTEQATKAASLIEGLDNNAENIAVLQVALKKLQAKAATLAQ